MKNRYNEIMEDVYKAYANSHNKFVDGFIHTIPMAHSKESFIETIKTDDEFAKKWGVKISERELSFDERQNYGIDVLGYESLLDYGHSQNDDDIILELLNEWNIPTKIITLDYNGEIVEYYEKD